MQNDICYVNVPRIYCQRRSREHYIGQKRRVRACDDTNSKNHSDFARAQDSGIATGYAATTVASIGFCLNSVILRPYFPCIPIGPVSFGTVAILGTEFFDENMFALKTSAQ